MSHRVSLLDRPRSHLVFAAAIFLVATTSFGLAVGVWHGYLDLEVYRLGAQTWLDGNAVYGPLPPIDGHIYLPFTYPPLAAIAFSPLAMMPTTVASAVMFALTLAAIALTAWLVIDRLWPQLDRGLRLAIVLLIVAVAQFLEPIRETLSYGQINAILMAAVAFDVLNRFARWPRGLLIGIAISIKLTPAGFLLLFLLRRDWRAMATTVASAVATAGIAWAIMPNDSRTYWFTKLSETGRIGAPHFAGNESLKGMATRLGLSDTASTIVWLGLAVIAVALAAYWMQRLLATGDITTALVVNAGAILLVSPVSWSHHWVWALPALMIAFSAIIAGQRSLLFCAVTVLALVMFAVGPHWLLPARNDAELGWGWWQQLIGASYVLVTFGTLIAGAVTTYRSSRSEAPRLLDDAPA